MWKMFQKLFLGIPKKSLICYFAATIVWALMNSYFTVLLSKVTAAKVEHEEFITAAIFFVGYILIWEGLEFVADIVHGIQNAHIQNESYRFYYRQIYKTKPEILQKENTGYIAGILTQLIERKNGMMMSMLLLAISGTYIVYLAIYVGRFSPWFTIVVTVLTLIGVTIRLLCSKKIAKSLKAMTVARGELNRVFLDGIINIGTVQKLRGIDFILKKTSHSCEDNLQATKAYAVGNEIGFTLYKAVNYLLCPICMFLALHLYTQDSSFPIVEYMAYLSIVTIQLVHNVQNIAGFIQNYNMFSASQQEMDQLVAECSENYTTTSIDRNFREIELKNINYQYEVGEKAVSITIEDFKIQKGERVCITGESGQGKTTMLKLLSGMIETEKNLYVDGQPTNQNIDAVYIAQDTEMLDMTLRENLTFGNEEITDERLIEMLQAVGLGEWFEKQELGLDTMLGERGVFVSTGQRQRLNLLRGLLIDKEIYLLDEPTSNVDDETEKRMIQLIMQILQTKTVIIVTHKEKISEICNSKYRFSDNRLKRI